MAADDIDIKTCCKEEDNLEVHQMSSELVIRICKVCGCRHFELDAETAILGAMGSSL